MNLEMKNKHVRDELRELKNKAHITKNNSQVLRNEEQELRNNFQVIKDKLHKHGNEIKSLENNFQVIIDKLNKLENEADVLIDNDKNKIVDQVNLTAKISYNNILFYDILAEDSKNSKDTILKMINSFSICAKQDTKKTDADNAAVCDKPDTNNDKGDTNNNNDKTDTEVEDKPDTKKKDAKKKDAKKKIVNRILKCKINQIL